MRGRESMVLQGLRGILLMLEHCTRGGESRAMGSEGRDLLQ